MNDAQSVTFLGGMALAANSCKDMRSLKSEKKKKAFVLTLNILSLQSKTKIVIFFFFILIYITSKSKILGRKFFHDLERQNSRYISAYSIIPHNDFKRKFII